MKIVILDTNTISNQDIDFSGFSSLGELSFYNQISEEEVCRVCRDAEIILANKMRFTKELLSCLPKLKYLGLFSTGYNNVDLEEATKQKIVVTNIPGYSTNAVAQHTFALILALSSQTARFNDLVHQGNWSYEDGRSVLQYPMLELAGKKLGIIGYGQIGSKVAEIAAAFGMQVLVHTRTKPCNCPHKLVTLEKILSESDFLSLHCPLNEDTNQIINKTSLEKMKTGAYLINTARGGLIDTEALIAALDNGQLAGVGLDTFTLEPIPENDPILNAPNCLLTPHIAWAPLETRQRCVAIALDNLGSWIACIPKNAVNLLK